MQLKTNYYQQYATAVEGLIPKCLGFCKDFGTTIQHLTHKLFVANRNAGYDEFILDKTNVERKFWIKATVLIPLYQY